MRNRFEQQYSIGQRLIIDTPINPKHKDKLEELIAGYSEMEIKGIIIYRLTLP